MFHFASLILVVILFHTALVKTWSLPFSGPHIADVNILLPPKMTYPVEYRLQGSDGCFEWSWDHHDVLSVVPHYNSTTTSCSTSARLESIAPYSGRKETAVYAYDKRSGIVIRCKVFIDNFSRIQIYHKSIKLDLDGLATLRVRAFDDEENEFSSLVGLQFMWQLLPESGGLPHQLVHVPLKESPLSDCGGLCGDLDIQNKLEDGGVFSDLYVVKGIAIGHESVSVHLLEPHFTHMGDKVVLTVAEAMSLDPPSPTFVLVGATLHYILKVIRANHPQVLMLPSPHHRWSVSNSTVAKIDSMMGSTHALSLGITIIVVEDTRVEGHAQISSLNVVLPDTLSLHLLPLTFTGDPIDGVEPFTAIEPWYIVIGCQYLVTLKVFSQGPSGHEIYITESDDLELHDNQSEYWDTTTVVPRDTIVVQHGWKKARILTAFSQGMGKLTASLGFFHGYHERKEFLKAIQDIIVCHKIKFSWDNTCDTSQGIILPWASGVYQEVQLRAFGGCAKKSGDYKWFSSDMTTVAISAFGVVQARKPGKVTVKVVSIFDSSNFDEVVVQVCTPASMVMIQNFFVETVVGSHSYPAVTMKASNGSYFYACDAFHSHIKWKTGSVSFTVANGTTKSLPVHNQGNFGLYTSKLGSPCSWTSIYASAPVQTMLHATLSKECHHADHSCHGSINLKATARIASYPPLTVHQVGDGSRFGGYRVDASEVGVNELFNLEKIYLVPQTNVDVMLYGGPDRWNNDVAYVDELEILNDKNHCVGDEVTVHRVSGSYKSWSSIFCKTFGNFTLVFKRGNLVGTDHPVPEIAEVSLSLTCDFPSTIVILVDERVNDLDAIRTATQAEHSTLGQMPATPITVANGQTIRVAAVGITKSGEAFANSSSLCLTWELSGCDGLAYWDDVMPKYHWERFLVLQNETGMCVVHAMIPGFCDPLAADDSQSYGNSKEKVTAAVRLQLVSMLSIKPEFSLLYFNPEAQANLSITGGSCFLEVAVNDSHVADVQPSPISPCSQLIVSPKGLGTALVTAYDIGLSPPITVSAVVQVADVDSIKIISREEINLMEKMHQSIELRAASTNGNAFCPSQYEFMNILVHIENNIVDVVENHDISNRGGGFVNEANFTIVARHLGRTTLYVSARQQSGLRILSHPIKIEVYPPPLIHPHHLFLVPGASYTLTVEGGPSIGVSVEYSSMDDKIGTVHQSTGKLSANSPGNTTLVATIYAHGDVICKAFGSVKVGVPSSARLNVQSGQLSIGNNMPIYPLFSEGNLFSFYELCKDYKWTVKDEKVLSFHVGHDMLSFADASRVRSPGLSDKKELDFIKVLLGRSAGRTNVEVTFSCDFPSGSKSRSRIYNASISIAVMPNLPLALGVPITWVLPPHYTTSSVLPLSFGTYSQKDDKSHQGAILYSVLRVCSDCHKSVEKDAIWIDGDRIRTIASNNLACIQARDPTTGMIDVASCVRVAEIDQVRITSKHLPFHVIDIAVGAELELPVSYRDSTGSPFYEENDILLYHAETNYPDIIFVENKHDGTGKVYVKALRHGKALVRVSISINPEKSDYILVSAGAVVDPQNPVLSLGSYLSFRVEGIVGEVSGRWHSDNESIISIDMSSGKAEAVGVGSAKVVYSCPTMMLQSQVKVSPRDFISVHSPNQMLTNLPFSTQGYRFRLTFSDAYVKLEDHGKRLGVSYDCRVDPYFVGYAKPWMDLETGEFYCLFFPFSPVELSHSVSSMGTKPFVSSVSIAASLKEDKNISGSTSVIFIGGFSILGLHELNMTPDSNETAVTIVGNTDVEFYWNERGIIDIALISREDFGIGGHAQYKVKVKGAKRVKDKITIMLAATGQKEEIYVNYDLGEEAVGSTLLTSVAGVLSILLFTIAVFICFLDRRNQSQLRTTPSIVEPVTPERSSSVILNQQSSPRTPQPFLNYLKTTIEDTPNYKREARRRFNPQNTF